MYTWSGLTNVGRTRTPGLAGFLAFTRTPGLAGFLAFTRTPGLAGFLAFTRTKLFWGYNRTCLQLVAITK